MVRLRKTIADMCRKFESIADIIALFTQFYLFLFIIRVDSIELGTPEIIMIMTVTVIIFIIIIIIIICDDTNMILI